MEDGELPEDADAGEEFKQDYSASDDVRGTGTVVQSDRKSFNSNQSGWSRRDNNQRTSKMVNAFVFFLLMRFILGYESNAKECYFL